jgi:hypothetical protein
MSHPPIYPIYPSSFPTSAGQVLIGVAKGEFFEKECVIHSCWAIIGFALGKTLPDDHPIVMRLSESECCQQLERAAITRDEGMRTLDWSSVLKFALNLLEQYLITK